MSHIIQSLWIGDDFSKMEQLCTKSFIDNGHEYHLYIYGDVKNIPEGIIVKDGNEIIPEDQIFRYKNGSLSAFSNLFRFALLYKKGGYWVDTDLICTRYFVFKEPFVFTSEPVFGSERINAGLIKMPKNSEEAKDAFLIQIENKKKIVTGQMTWGGGPTCVKYLVNKYKLQKYVLPWQGICTCDAYFFMTLLDPNIKKNQWFFSSKTKTKRQMPSYIIDNVKDIPNNTVGIHLWNEMWRQKNIDKNSSFHPNSIYELYKKKHNI